MTFSHFPFMFSRAVWLATCVCLAARILEGTNHMVEPSQAEAFSPSTNENESYLAAPTKGIGETLRPEGEPDPEKEETNFNSEVSKDLPNPDADSAFENISTEPEEEPSPKEVTTKPKLESEQEDAAEQVTSEKKSEDVAEKVANKPKIKPDPDKSAENVTSESSTESGPKTVEIELKGEKARKDATNNTASLKERPERPFVPKRVEFMERRRKIARSRTARIKNKSRPESGKPVGAKQGQRRETQNKSKRVTNMSRRKEIVLKRQMALKKRLEALKKKEAALMKDKTTPKTPPEQNETASKEIATEIETVETVPAIEEKLNKTTTSATETDTPAEIQMTVEKNVTAPSAKVSPKASTRSIETVEAKPNETKPEHIETTRVMNETSPVKTGIARKKNETVHQIETSATKTETDPLRTKVASSNETVPENNKTAHIVIELKTGLNETVPERKEPMQSETVPSKIQPTSTVLETGKGKGDTSNLKLEIRVPKNKTAKDVDLSPAHSHCKKLTISRRQLEALIKEGFNKGISMKSGTVGEGHHLGRRLIDFRMRIQASENFKQKLKLPGKKVTVKRISKKKQKH